MRTQPSAHLIGLILSILFVLASLNAAYAGVHSYSENFSTTQYKDTLNTTALWDTTTGELKLPPFVPTLVGSCDTSGNAYCLVISGDYAYVADTGSGLQVIDISDPTNPVAAGSYDTPGSSSDVATSGDYAYVADGVLGLQVVDISDPTTPALAGSYDTPGNAIGIAVSGDYAYVADWASGLMVLDISDPTTPALAGNYDTPGNAYDVAISGDRAYVADYASGLQVIDISDPTTPVLAGSCATAAEAFHIVISGDHAYVAEYVSGLQVIDISDPDNPVVVGSYDTPGYAWDVAVSGTFVYVADQGGGLQVIDVSDPTNPVLVSNCSTPGEARGVAIAGEYAYIGDHGSGLQVIRMADPVPPTLTGSCDTPDYAWGVTISGSHALVADRYSGLQVVDVGDPANPTVVGTYNTPDAALGVAVSGDYALVADGGSGLQVIDISDPEAPFLAGTYATSGDAGGVAVEGGHAFVVGATFLKVIDISDPTALTLVGECNTLSGPVHVAISGDHAFVADQMSGLRVIDISDLTNPVVVMTCDTPGFAFAVAVSGDHAFVADGIYGLQVVDIGDPSNPAIVGSCDTGFGRAVVVSGDHAFVACGDYGLQEIDISDPTNPVVVATCDTPDFASGLTVAGRHVLVGSSYSGLQLIQVFQSDVDLDGNVGQSVAVDASTDAILWGRLATVQTDTITWELSADGGAHWQDVVPNEPWVEMTVPGSDLVWRSTHTWEPSTGNPTVSQVHIDWLAEAASIDSIIDIPNDQGRQAGIYWTRSGYDFVGSGTPITEYAIYRKIDPDLAAVQSSLDRVNGIADPLQATGKGGAAAGLPPGDWHYVLTAPALAEDNYAAVVPTLADSTVSDGMYYSIFIVLALTETPAVHFDSPPDSGYSVDNLAPSVPAEFAVAYQAPGGNQLTWEPVADPDACYCCIYRSTNPAFTPTPQELVHTTVEDSWLDPVSEGWRYYYKITAVDFSGNESDPAVPESATGIEAAVSPRSFALHQNVPNPFNPMTIIRYDVPTQHANVTLQVYDVRGRLVRTLVDGEQSSGQKTAVWDGKDSHGQSVASGVFFYRLTGPDFQRTRKMVLLR